MGVNTKRRKRRGKHRKNCTCLKCCEIRADKKSVKQMTKFIVIEDWDSK